jgi:hypothetical protein
MLSPSFLFSLSYDYKLFMSKEIEIKNNISLNDKIVDNFKLDGSTIKIGFSYTPRQLPINIF